MQPGGFYVVDRGYVDYDLFQELHDLPCSFLCRVKNNAAYEVQEEHALAPAAVHAGVVRDVVLRRLGTAHHTRLLPQPFRMVQIATGKTRQDGTPDVVVLVTNRLDLDAELLAVAYRYRWAVELFFRWVKCVLGCSTFAESGDQRGTPPGVCRLYCEPADQPVGRTSTDITKTTRLCYRTLLTSVFHAVAPQLTVVTNTIA